jgi:stage II sporulation protein R
MKNLYYNNKLTFSNLNYDSLYGKIIAFMFMLLLCSIFLVKAFTTKESSNTVQEGLASEILRFHVIANSDSEADQALKLKIKGELTKDLRPKLEHARDIVEARKILQDNLKEMEKISNDIINESGFNYTATASIEKGYFPLKVYGDLSLPPGEYEAVRVELGLAKGQNWWCIMFPPLCFVDSTYSVVPDSSKEQLKYVLTDEEYDSIVSKKEVKVKVKSKIISWIKDICKD